jgi:Replication protein A OB domain
LVAYVVSIGEITMVELKSRKSNDADEPLEEDVKKDSPAKDNMIEKRCVVLTDPSELTIVLTFWGHSARLARNYEGKILVIKNVSVSYYAGRTLKVSDDTQVMVSVNCSFSEL